MWIYLNFYPLFPTRVAEYFPLLLFDCYAFSVDCCNLYLYFLLRRRNKSSLSRTSLNSILTLNISKIFITITVLGKSLYTDLGSLNGTFDCGCTTVWKFSNFPATLILREINFSWYQRVKDWHFNLLGGFEFWFLKNFTLEKIKSCQKSEI